MLNASHLSSKHVWKLVEIIKIREMNVDINKIISSNEIHQKQNKIQILKYAMEMAQWNSQDGDNYLTELLVEQDEDKADQTVQPQLHNFHMRCVERSHYVSGMKNMLSEFVSHFSRRHNQIDVASGLAVPSLNTRQCETARPLSSFFTHTTNCYFHHVMKPSSWIENYLRLFYWRLKKNLIS